MAWVIAGRFEVKLKHQLLLLALLSLLFPISSWLSMKSIDKEYRQGLERATENTLQSLQSAVLQWTDSHDTALHQGVVFTPLDDWILDGDSAEWQHVPAYHFDNNEQNLIVQTGEIENQIAVFLKFSDTSPSYDDYVMIGLANDQGLFQLKIQRQPEGLVQNRQDDIEHRAYWHEVVDGYVLELILPNLNYHHFGVVANNKQGDGNRFTGHLDDSSHLQLQPILGQNHELQQFIDNITPLNSRFVIYDAQRSLIYESNKLSENPKVSKWQWLLTPFYRWLFGIEHNQAQQSWFYNDANGLAGIQKTLKGQNLTFELQNLLPKGQQAMIQTVLKASLLTLGFVLLVLLVYFVYAIILAWRIKRLNHSLQQVLDDSGFHLVKLPSTDAKDEIGQLSRGIESMLKELNHYTQYLKDLGSRLSHEMRTPLAIVQSSLDNLELENNPDFLQRAKHGTQRLKFILNQLSELSRLKQSLEKSPKQDFDLVPLIQQLGSSYAAIIPQFKLNIEPETATINGCPDLIAQMLDKLIDNAKDFTPNTGSIELKLQKVDTKTELSVFNTGSQLPQNADVNLFDSLVSLRTEEEKTETAHLGLGLHLVKLIARYHQAQTKAENFENGVKFSIQFEK